MNQSETSLGSSKPIKRLNLLFADCIPETAYVTAHILFIVIWSGYQDFCTFKRKGWVNFSGTLLTSRGKSLLKNLVLVILRKSICLNRNLVTFFREWFTPRLTLNCDRIKYFLLWFVRMGEWEVRPTWVRVIMSNLHFVL